MDKREFLRTAGGALGSASLGLLFTPAQLLAFSRLPVAELAGRADFWDVLRAKYLVPADYVHLEHGYYSMQSQPVLERFIGHVRAVNAQSSRYMRTVQGANKARVQARLAALAGCSPEELIITRNTTESLDTVVSGFDWKAGDEAVMAVHDYGAMLDQFALMGRRWGVVNRTVTVPLESSVAWVAGTQLRLMNLGAGVVTVVGAGGVTINGSPLTLAQYKEGTLTKTGTNTWTFTSSASAAPSSGTATVATSQSTSSTSYTDLATVGPSVTLTTGTKALVIITAEVRPPSGDNGYASVAVSGATTVAASDTWANYYVAGTSIYARASASHIFTGLTAGSNVFTMKFRTASGTTTFVNREIIVMDLGS